MSSKKTMRGHTGVITCSCISNDGSVLITGSRDMTIKGWDVSNSRNGCHLLFTLSGHKKWVYSVDISNDNEYITSGSGDKHIILWGVLRKVIIRKINHHSDSVTCVKFNSNGSEIVSASSDFSICLSNMRNGKLIKRFIGHEYIVSGVNFNNDCSKIISTSFDGSLCLWDKETGKMINKFETKIDISRLCIISPDDNLVISFGNRKIFVWCVKTCKILKIFECHENKADLVSFNNDGTSFYSFGIDEENDILECFEQKIPTRFL
jgi:WD40 repeat protein